jgi:ribosomal protein S1
MAVHLRRNFLREFPVSDENLEVPAIDNAPVAEVSVPEAPEAEAAPSGASEVNQAQAAQASEAEAGLTLETLKPRTALKGKIARVDLGGAFADVGLGVDGFIHISQIVSDKPVTRVADVLKVGDEVDVYVSRVNPARKRIELTMSKPAAFDWTNLHLGSKLENVKVVSVESFGAFVDFDGPKHGLIPFNLMPRGMRPKVGDPIDVVWVVEVDEAKRRIGLTMMEPAALPWEKIRKGEKLTGRVTRVERNSAYVDIGAERDGMIRASTLGMSFVDMHSFVTEGEQINVRVIKVDPGKRQIDLALEGVNPNDYALSSGPEEELSPFAAAFQRAQRLKRAQVASEAGDRPVKKSNPQNDLLDRTLQQMQDSKK